MQPLGGRCASGGSVASGASSQERSPQSFVSSSVEMHRPHSEAWCKCLQTRIAPFSVAMWFKTLESGHLPHFSCCLQKQSCHLLARGTPRDFTVHSRPSRERNPQGGLFGSLAAQSPFAGYAPKTLAVLHIDATNATSRRTSLSSNITATECATNVPTTTQVNVNDDDLASPKQVGPRSAVGDSRRDGNTRSLLTLCPWQ